MNSAWRISLLVGVALSLCGCFASRTDGDTRILRLPDDRSLGELWIVEAQPGVFSERGERWVATASGRVRVRVPDGWLLQLRASSTAATIR